MPCISPFAETTATIGACLPFAFHLVTRFVLTFSRDTGSSISFVGTGTCTGKVTCIRELSGITLGVLDFLGFEITPFGILYSITKWFQRFRSFDLTFGLGQRPYLRFRHLMLKPFLT